MNLINVLILGIVEGITEFLPISSTAHLILVSRLLNIPQTDFQKFFEVFIQAGAILAVVVIYLRCVLTNKRLMTKVIASFFPTATVGFILYKIIKNIFFVSTYLMGWAFFIIGLGFLLVEYLVKNKKIKLVQSIKRLNYKTAIIIGLVQSLAVVPGASRVGVVLLAMMIMGFRRDESALYSFLLAVPTILAAAAYDLYKSRNLLTASSTNIALLAIGFLVSFVSAYFVVRWFIRYLQNKTLINFGIYRIGLAIILMLSP